MYRLKKEYEGQSVVSFLPNGKEIHLENANQKDLAEAYNAGNNKFISYTKIQKPKKK